MRPSVASGAAIVDSYWLDASIWATGPDMNQSVEIKNKNEGHCSGFLEAIIPHPSLLCAEPSGLFGSLVASFFHERGWLGGRGGGRGGEARTDEGREAWQGERKNLPLASL